MYDENAVRFYKLPDAIELPKQKIEKKYYMEDIVSAYRELIRKNEEKKKKVCEELTVQIEALKDEYSLSKYTYKENEKQCNNILKEIEYDNNEGANSKAQHIIYSNEDHTIVLLINFNEHLQLIVSSKEGKYASFIFRKIAKILWA